MKDRRAWNIVIANILSSCIKYKFPFKIISLLVAYIPELILNEIIEDVLIDKDLEFKELGLLV